MSTVSQEHERDLPGDRDPTEPLTKPQSVSSTDEYKRNLKEAARLMACSDDELMRRPIIVVGAGRSGMNFLGDAIAQHPRLAVAHEPRLIWKAGNNRVSDALRPHHARPEVIADIRSRFSRGPTFISRNAARVNSQGRQPLEGDA